MVGLEGDADHLRIAAKRRGRRRHDAGEDGPIEVSDGEDCDAADRAQRYWE